MATFEVLTSSNVIGGGGSSYLSKTYAELSALITGSGLTIGQQYLVTDFATRHYIVDTTGTKPAGTPTVTGVTEPLLVTAIAVNKIDAVAKSTLYPQDIIHVDFVEENWTDDISFSLSGTIIPGWKGTIFFRHDTLLDNYTGYDFRNVKFRRWKTNAAAWSSSTTYGAGAYVTYSNVVYKSLQGGNLNKQPDIETSFWVALLDLTLTEYWNGNPTSTNGIPSNPSAFNDFKTFAETGTDTYETTCRSNHIEGFKDTETFFDIAGTILSNNVFMLQSEGYFSVYSNEIAAESFGNTIMGVYFYSNSIEAFFNYNSIGENFNYNSIGTSFYSNSIGVNFFSNSIGANFFSNSIGANFNSNSIGANFSSNSIGVNFRKVTAQPNVNNQSAGSWTLIYANHPKELIEGLTSGEFWIRYIDADGVQQIVTAST
jgi:hypothetical protein